jgi:two-component system OmpR family response regulator/two-component system response regulator QseB
VRVLIVEDEVKLAALIRRGLRDEGMLADVAVKGEDALWMAGATAYDAIVLDVMLPGLDGFAVCRRLRHDGVWSPVLMLTARDAVADRIDGLDAGADDYLVKPFELDELSARMRAVLRRHSGRAQPLLSHGGVTLDPATRQVARDGVPVLLSAREFAVLEALMARPGALLSRAQLEDRLYGWGEEIESNAVSVYVHQLRRKLGADFIRTVRGVGYFIDAAA